MFRYIVTAFLLSQELASEYTSWLQHGHLEAVVVQGGAISAEVLALDPTPEDNRFAVQSSYLFPSRAAYEAYQAGPAVALREDGRRLFAETGKVVEWRRSTAEVILSIPASSPSSSVTVGAGGDVAPPAPKTEWPELVGKPSIGTSIIQKPF
jgi:hypothetical protein